MIGTVYIGQDKSEPVLKIYNRTRYDTADLVNAITKYFTGWKSGFSFDHRDEWPRIVVLEEWRGSVSNAPCKAGKINERLRTLKILRPEKADQTKCVVDRVVDLETWRASQDVIGHFVWMIGNLFGRWEKLPNDLLRQQGSTVKILPKKQEPDMAEIEKYIANEFAFFAKNQIERMHQAADTMSRRLKSRASWSKTLGFDVEKVIREQSPPRVQVWLEAMSDPRRMREERTHEVVEDKRAKPKLVFHGEVA